MEKYKRQDVTPVEKENERDENYQGSNPQIDCERTSGNKISPVFVDETKTFICNNLITANKEDNANS